VFYEDVKFDRARMLIQHRRPMAGGGYILLSTELVLNLMLNAGRDFIHQQVYGTSGLGSNGFNYIALTNNVLTPAGADTTLPGEITLNGLARAQGSVTHVVGSNQTTIDHTFVATGPQSAQGAALFNAASGGVMNHEFTFAQKNLVTADTIQVTIVITAG